MSVLISWRSVSAADEAAFVTLQCRTDIPCHCWARVSPVKPKIHRVSRTKRGLSMPEEYYFCFVAYVDIEQNEAGDTLDHTFTCPDWPYCTTKYFYFFGKQGTVFSKSTSAWWPHHNRNKQPAWSLLLTEPWTWHEVPCPSFELLFTEPWSPEPPDFELFFTETWTPEPMPWGWGYLFMTERWDS